jgi:hypothetical protein
MGAILINMNVDGVEFWVEENELRRCEVEAGYQKVELNLTGRRRSNEEGR